MQLRAAYELQMWKEARELEFEQSLKKREAAQFQALADAFKHQEVERQLLAQRKLKEYGELELVLRNTLAEVEKRERHLAAEEARVARAKVEMAREHEQRLADAREASRRAQQQADHLVEMQRVKSAACEEESAKWRRQVVECEKKLADKEAEFARYKEKENARPEVRLQSELNVMHLEKVI